MIVKLEVCMYAGNGVTLFQQTMRVPQTIITIWAKTTYHTAELKY